MHVTALLVVCNSPSLHHVCLYGSNLGQDHNLFFLLLNLHTHCNGIALEVQLLNTNNVSLETQPQAAAADRGCLYDALGHRPNLFSEFPRTGGSAAQA